MNNIKIDKVGSTRFIHIPGVGIGMYMGMDSTLTTFPEMSSVSWETDPEIIAGKAVVPYGKDNNLPIEIQDIMEKIIWPLVYWNGRRGYYLVRDPNYIRKSMKTVKLPGNGITIKRFGSG